MLETTKETSIMSLRKTIKGWPVILIVLSLFAVYFEEKLYFWENLLPIPFAFFVLATALAIVYYVPRRIILKESLVRITPESRAILFYFIAIQTSILGMLMKGATVDHARHFFKTDLHLFFYIAFVFVMLGLLNRHLFWKVLRLYYLCGLVAAFIGILQSIHVNYWTIPWMDRFLFGSSFLYKDPGSYYRAGSTLGEPGEFGYFLIHWIGIGTAYLLSRRRKRELINIGIFLTALLMSAPLGAIITVIVFIFWGVIEFRINIGFLRSVTVIVSIVLLFTFLSFQSSFFHLLIIDRFTSAVSGSDGSANVRVNSSKMAIQVWLDNPIVGVGIGNYRFYRLEKLGVHYRGGVIRAGGVDSIYSLTLVENGLVGFIALSTMILIIIKLPRSMQSPGRQSRGENNSCSMFTQEWIFTKMFRTLVTMNFFELFIVGRFLYPKLWFNIALFIYLKNLQRTSSRNMKLGG